MPPLDPAMAGLGPAAGIPGTSPMGDPAMGGAPQPQPPAEPMGPPQPQQTGAGLHPELQNLAAMLPEEELDAIGELVCKEAELDDKSRQDWLDMHAHWIRLYYQNDAPLNPPWQGSSDESIPMLAEACNQFHARAFQAFFPNRSIIQALPTGQIEKADIERAKRVGKHMSWQLMVRDKTYRKRKDALLLSVALHGSMFTKVYYDPRLKRNCVENVRAEDLILPYGIGPRELEDLPRKTHVIYMSVNKTRILAAGGYFLSPCEPWKHTEGAAPTQEAHDEAQGHRQPGLGDAYYAKLYEQHRLLDLDDDGIEEPYIVTVDATTKKVQRISIRYEADDFGQPVYDKEPIECFTHWMFLPNPDGVYGLGLGHLVGQINTAVNKMLRQTIDKGTLNNMASGLISDALPLRGGEIELEMGKFRKVASVGRIADHIHEFQFGEPSAVIQSIIELLMQRGDRLATVTEALTGQMDKVQQPTVVLALIEQGLQVFSTVYQRLYDAWEEELAKLYRLNAKFMPEEEYVTVLDVGGLERFKIGRTDYQNDLRVVPVVDPKMATDQQKLAHAQAEWEFLSQNPLVLSSPVHFYNASRRYLEAIDTRAIDEVLPRPQMEPQRVDDPQIENTGLLMPKPIMPPVFPDQDHLKHLMAHETIKNDPQYAAFLTPEALAVLDHHQKMHIALLYGTTETDVMESPDGPFGGGAMAQGPSDRMGAQTTFGPLQPEPAMGGVPGGPDPTAAGAGGSPQFSGGANRPPGPVQE